MDGRHSRDVTGRSDLVTAGEHYLNYVCNSWAHQWRKRKAAGAMIVVRYADDAIIGFQRHVAAHQLVRELRARLAAFSLDLHGDKSRPSKFGRFAAEQRTDKGLSKPEAVDFLGSSHICAKAEGGRFPLVRHTMRKHMQAKLVEIKEALYPMLHAPVPTVLHIDKVCSSISLFDKELFPAIGVSLTTG